MTNAEEEVEAIRRMGDEYYDRIWRQVEADWNRDGADAKRRLARLRRSRPRKGPLLTFLVFVLLLMALGVYAALNWNRTPYDPLGFIVISLCINGGVTVYFLANDRWRSCLGRLYLLLWWGIPLFLIALSPEVPSAIVAVGGLVYIALLLVLSLPLYRAISVKDKEAGLEAIFWAFQFESAGDGFGGDGVDDVDVGCF